MLTCHRNINNNKSLSQTELSRVKRIQIYVSAKAGGLMPPNSVMVSYYKLQSELVYVNIDTYIYFLTNEGKSVQTYAP